MKNTINLIKANYKEYLKSSISRGSFLGFAIFSVYMVGIFMTNNESAIASKNLSLVFLIISILLGFCLIFIRELNRDKKAEYHILNGITGVYLIMMFGTIVSFLSLFIPVIFKIFINSTILTIFIMWILEYLYLKNISNTLNCSVYTKAKKGLYLELDKRIESMEEFFEELNKYCSQFENVEYISIDNLPAIIRIDGQLYEANLVEYYSVIGTSISAISIKTV